MAMKFKEYRKFISTEVILLDNSFVWYHNTNTYMKFKEHSKYTRIELEAEDGTVYATNEKGSSWERLCGQSWEPVWSSEEDSCNAAFKEYFSSIAQR